MKKKRRIHTICAIVCFLFAVSACGDSRKHKEDLPSVTMQDANDEEHSGSDEDDETGNDETKEEIPAEESNEEGGIRNDPESGMMGQLPDEENGILEVYAGRDVISIPDNIMIALVSPQEILTGNPILYDRFRIDGWVFEWLISDDYDEESWGRLEDGVLVISREGAAEEMQVIRVTAEGGLSHIHL
ncbi:MAG: hypothetical protein K2K87_03175, partial [Lachnospiraceae bacterium]|nr:hypothetical protein [Lachnospiraceae bacterium]